jgi:hypothetical protein
VRVAFAEQVGTHALRTLDVPIVKERRQADAQVVVVGLQATQPHRHLRPTELSFGTLGEPEEIGRVTVSGPRPQLRSLAQTIIRVLTERLELPVPPIFIRAWFGDHHGLGYQMQQDAR